MPVGAITAYYGTTAPTNWLICDGTSFSSTTYPALAALLGGTTLPNLKGKVVVGIDGADLDFDVLGDTGGAKTVALSTAELASHGHSHTHGTHSHSHTHGSHSHSHNHGSNSVGAESGHTHTEIASGQGNILLTPGASNYNLNFAAVNTGGSSGHDHTFTPTTDATGTTPSADATTATPTVDATTAGSGTAHQNLQPYVALSYIIRAA